ncbi:MAG: redoxin domain-containing protein [Bacteroidales bacterium]|nr:redoxin domain-containing protein [Bacteroidales bacterium]
MKRVYNIQLFLVVFSLMIMSSCTEKQHSVIVQGQLKGSHSELVIISELTPQQLVNIDSTILDKDGKFHFEINSQQSGFYVIHIGRSNYIRLQIEPHDNIYIQGNLDDDLSTYTVQGSEASELLSIYNRVLSVNEKQADSLGQVFLDKRHLDDFPLIKKQIDSAYERIFNRQFYFTVDLIENNSNQLASLLLINEYFGRSPLFNENEHLKYFTLLDSILFTKYPENKHVIDHHNRVQDFLQKEKRNRLAKDRFDIGQPFPDLNLPNMDGEMQSVLNSKSELTLVYIWSSMNAQSRKQNRDLMELYQDFHKQGFEIYGISIDNNLSLWKNALKIDRIEWVSVCDGKGSNSPLIDLFALDKLPVSFLIDRNMKIVGTNMVIEDLIEKLKTLD